MVIGQSRGGLFARVLGVRRPGSGALDRHARLATQLAAAVHPLIWIQGAAIAGLGALGVPGFASHRCRNGDCCAEFTTDLAAPLPAGVRFASIYSKRDGIVDWPACLDPHAVHLEVRSTHCGMGVNPAVYELLDSELHAPRPHARHRRPAARAPPPDCAKRVQHAALVLQRRVPI